MDEITRAQVAPVGVDLAKQVIQVHAVDASGRRLAPRAFKRDQFFAWCRQLPAGCVLAMEACSSAHHWARKLIAQGLDARLIAAHFVTPYRMEGKGGKNDAPDAAAICEAASRPSMRFVPFKTCEQQSVMSLHRAREGLKEERTDCINQIRGVLTEFGLVFGKSPKVLRAVPADIIEDASNELSTTARPVVQRAFDHGRELDEHMHWCDQQLGQHVRASPAARPATRRRPTINPRPLRGLSSAASHDTDHLQNKGNAFQPSRALEDAFDRSDRQLVNSVNRAVRQSRPTPYREWSPAERFVSEPAP